MTEQVSYNFAKIEIEPTKPGKDGAGDTFMFAEMRMPEKEYVLTAAEHTADAKVYAKPLTFTATVSADYSDPDDGFVLV